MTIWRFLLIVFAVPVILRPAVVLPADLNPGDHYRIAFLTSVAHDSLSTNIDVYDQFVTSVANAPGSVLAPLNATWSVIGSTDAVSARDHLGEFTEPIYRPDGVRVATGSAGLFFGVLADPTVPVFIGHVQNPISITEFGTVYSTGGGLTGATCCVFTGTYADGSRAGPGGTLGHFNAAFGVWNDVYDDMYWAEGLPVDPGIIRLPFYGISSVQTVPDAPVPEPGTGIFVLIPVVFGGGWFLVFAAGPLRSQSWPGRCRATPSLSSSGPQVNRS